MIRIGVLIAHSLVRAGIISILKSCGFESIGEAASAEDLMRNLQEPLPEIVLVGLPADSADVADVMQTVKAWPTETKVVFLAPSLDVKQLSECFSAGADGYLLENLSAEALGQSLTLVSAGEKVFPSEMAAVISHLVGNLCVADGAIELQSLSAQELKILRLLADGSSNKVIATTLHMAESTAKLHLRNILRKLRASNRTQAALWAQLHGIGIESSNGFATEAMTGLVLGRQLPAPGVLSQRNSLGTRR